MDSLVELLSIDGYIPVNKDLARLLGINEAIIIGELIAEYKYWKNHNGLTEDGYFYSTVENLEKNTTLNEFTQRKIIKHLCTLNIVKTKRRDIPAKRYFWINFEVLEKLLMSKEL